MGIKEVTTTLGNAKRQKVSTLFGGDGVTPRLSYGVVGARCGVTNRGVSNFSVGDFSVSFAGLSYRGATP